MPNNDGSAGAGRDGKLRELVESIRESADFIRVTGDSDDVITSGRSILADVRQIDELLAVPDPLASDTGQGERPTLAQALERQVAMALRASEMAGMKPDEKAFYEGKAAGIRQALNSVRISASAPLASSSETQGAYQPPAVHHMCRPSNLPDAPPFASWCHHVRTWVDGAAQQDDYKCSACGALISTNISEWSQPASASPSDDGARQPQEPK